MYLGEHNKAMTETGKARTAVPLQKSRNVDSKGGTPRQVSKSLQQAPALKAPPRLPPEPLCTLLSLGLTAAVCALCRAPMVGRDVGVSSAAEVDCVSMEIGDLSVSSAARVDGVSMEIYQRSACPAARASVCCTPRC